MQQVTITRTQTGVARGQAVDPETQEPKPIVVAVVVDTDSGEQYHFPMSPEAAAEWGTQLKGEEPEGPTGPDLLVPERPPTKEELEVMAQAAKGNIR